VVEVIDKKITLQYDDLDPMLSVSFFQNGTQVSRTKTSCDPFVLVVDKTDKTAPFTATVTGLAQLFEDDSLQCTQLAGGVFIMNLLRTIPAGLNECYPICNKDFVGTGASMATEDGALAVPFSADPYTSTYTLMYSGPQQS
jgi:hypothetical protein